MKTLRELTQRVMIWSLTLPTAPDRQTKMIDNHLAQPPLTSLH